MQHSYTCNNYNQNKWYTGAADILCLSNIFSICNPEQKELELRTSNMWLIGGCSVEYKCLSLHRPSGASTLIVHVSHGCVLRVLRCIVWSVRGRRKLLWHDVLSFSVRHLSQSFILWRLLDVPCVVSPRPSLEHVLTGTSWAKIPAHNGKAFSCHMLMVTLSCRTPSLPSGLMYPRSLDCICVSFVSAVYGQGKFIITLAESIQLQWTDKGF